MTNAFAYDAAGNLLTRTLPGGATEMVYDLRGNITSITDPLGAKTQFEYDALGRIAGITDALGGKTAYVYDETGNLVTVIDALGAVSAFEYDAAGNLTGMTDPLGHTANLAYNKLGQATRLTQKNGGVVSSQFDKAGRLVKEIDPMGTATSYRHDALGRVTQVIDALELEFEPDALRAIAHQAIERKSGVRGLRAIIETALLDTMFELPVRENVAKCVITTEAVHGGKPSKRRMPSKQWKDENGKRAGSVS